MANYYMIGGDGKEYGPVDAAQLRQWVADGRANGQTQVRPVDGGPYTTLAAVPELTGAPSTPQPEPNYASFTSPGASDYFMRGGDGKEYGPVSAQQLRQWMAEGRANAQTMVRAANGGPYVALGMLPEFNGPAGAQPMVNLPLAQRLAQNSGNENADSAQLIKRLSAILAESAGWMKFLAVVSFVGAGFTVLGTYGLGLLWCWAPIWMGVVLWNAAGTAQQAVFTGSEADISKALDQLRFYFKLSGILRIVMVGVGLLFLVLFFGIIMAAVSAAAGHAQ